MKELKKQQLGEVSFTDSETAQADWRRSEQGQDIGSVPGVVFVLLWS